MAPPFWLQASAGVLLVAQRKRRREFFLIGRDLTLQRLRREEYASLLRAADVRRG